MRCTYMSDLHLEAQDVELTLPQGDVLIIAGDLCNAKYIAPARADIYSQVQRDRVARFLDQATAKFNHVLFVTGNHEHYEFIFDDTIAMLRENFDGVNILDNEFIDIEGVRFFGTTLWTDFLGRSQECMDAVRRRIGEFLLVRKRHQNQYDEVILKKFQPEDALAQFDLSLKALNHVRDDGFTGPLIVVTHHPPSLQSLNPNFDRNEMDGAFASDLEAQIMRLVNVPYWIHGHTHIRKKYKIGNTKILANCLGYVERDPGSQEFSSECYFEVR